MAATVEIDEGNGTNAATVTHNITNSNMGSTDAANLDPVAYPITAGTNSYEKWQRFDVTNMGGSSAIRNLKVWRTGALGGSDTHVCNLHSTQGTYDAHKQTTGVTPVATASTIATQTMPTAAPGTANLGVGGSLTGQLTATGQSDYIVHQIQVNAGSTAGTTMTMNYQYDEIA
jgi:hypothetical protein